MTSAVSGISRKTIAAINSEVGDNFQLETIINNILIKSKSTAKKFTTDDDLYLSHESSITTLFRTLSLEPLSIVRNLFGWYIAMSFGPVTTNKFRQNAAHFHMAVTGIDSEIPQWHVCYNYANTHLPYAVSRIFVDKHFSAKDKKEATILVEEIKKSFHNLLVSNTWLDAQTKALAIEKLTAIRENVGYPEWVVNDTELDDYYKFLKNIQIIKGKVFESLLQIQSGLTRNVFESVGVKQTHSHL